MFVWKYEYAYDMFLDGRMEEDCQIFSTKENAFKYAEMQGKSKTDFTGDDESGYYANYVGKDDSETYYISKVKIDAGLEIERD